MTQPIICIPYVNNDIHKKQLCDTFNKYNFGRIKRIDLIKINKSQRAFIHYIYWNDNIKTKQALEWLNNGDDIKVMYDEPWYWKCSAFKSMK